MELFQDWRWNTVPGVPSLERAAYEGKSGTGAHTHERTHAVVAEAVFATMVKAPNREQTPEVCKQPPRHASSLVMFKEQDLLKTKMGLSASTRR